MFISFCHYFCPCLLQIIHFVFQLSLTHAYYKEPIPSIAETGENIIIEITSMCYDDNTTHLDYEAIRHHLRIRCFVGEVQSLEWRDHINGVGFSSYDVCKDRKKLTALLTKIRLDKQYRDWYGSCENVYPWNVPLIVSFMPPDLTKLADEVLASAGIPYFASIDYRDSNIIENSMNDIPYLTQNEYTITSDNLLYSDKYLILNIVRGYHVRHILLLYSDRDEQSPLSFHQNQIWKELIKEPNICVDMMDLTNSSKNNISFLMEYIKRRKQIKLIIIWPRISTSLDFIKKTNSYGDRIWIWYRDKYLHPIKSGCHFILQHPLNYGYFDYFKYENIQKYLPRETLSNILNDPWTKRFNDEKRFNSSIKDILSHLSVNKTRIGEHIDLLFRQIYELTLQLAFVGIEFLVPFLRAFIGLKVKLWPYHNNCNATILNELNVKIRSYQGQVLHCNPIKCPPGNEPFKTVFTRPGFVKNFGWKCKKCASDKVKLNYSTERCISCPGVTVPGKDRINCFDPYTDEFLMFTDNKSIIVLSILIPILVYNMGLIFLFGYQRKTPIIIASGSTSNIFKLSAHLLISIEVLVLFFGKLNDTKCTLQVVTTGLSFTIILSLLLTQTQKTLYVFKAKVQITRNDVILTKVVQIFVSVILIAIQILISVISYIQLNPTVKTTIDTSYKKRKVACNNELFFRVQFVYILVLSILCSIQALRARNLPKYFTATAEIGYSMYITVVVTSVRFPILASENVDDKNFANALFILVLNGILMVIRYTKTFYTLIFHPEKNTKEYVRNILLRNVRQQTDEDIAERSRQDKNQEDDENIRNKNK